jgi:Zinc finger C-x8-C-x5-C-x3-H type (and similar)
VRFPSNSPDSIVSCLRIGGKSLVHPVNFKPNDKSSPARSQDWTKAQTLQSNSQQNFDITAIMCVHNVNMHRHFGPGGMYTIQHAPQPAFWQVQLVPYPGIAQPYVITQPYAAQPQALAPHGPPPIRANAAPSSSGSSRVFTPPSNTPSPTRPKHIHNNINGNNTGNYQPCRYYMAGRCTRGSACNYSHNIPHDFRKPVNKAPKTPEAAKATEAPKGVRNKFGFVIESGVVNGPKNLGASGILQLSRDRKNPVAPILHDCFICKYDVECLCGDFLSGLKE